MPIGLEELVGEGSGGSSAGPSGGFGDVDTATQGLRAALADLDSSLNEDQGLVNGAGPLESILFGDSSEEAGTLNKLAKAVLPGDSQERLNKTQRAITTIRSNFFKDGVLAVDLKGALSNQEGAKLETLLTGLSVSDGDEHLRGVVSRVKGLVDLAAQRQTHIRTGRISAKNGQHYAVNPSGEEQRVITYIGTDGSLKASFVDANTPEPPQFFSFETDATASGIKSMKSGEAYLLDGKLFVKGSDS